MRSILRIADINVQYLSFDMKRDMHRSSGGMGLGQNPWKMQNQSGINLHTHPGKQKYKSTCIPLFTWFFLFIEGVLVANKIDLDERRVISPKAGMEFAESNGLKYFECSAVSLNTENAFLFWKVSKTASLLISKVFEFLAVSFVKMEAST